jgi:hypothetical protein
MHIIEKVFVVVFVFYRLILASLLCGILVTSLNIFLNASLIPFLDLFKRCQLCDANPTIAIPINEHLSLFRDNPRHKLLDKYVIFAFLAISFLLLVGVRSFVNYITSMIFGMYY